MFNPVAPYQYLLPSLYLSVADIANPSLKLCVCGSRTWISHDIARFDDEHCQPSSGSAWPACPKTLIGPHGWGREGSTQFAQGLPDRCDSSAVCRLCRLELHNKHTHSYQKAATTNIRGTIIKFIPNYT